MTIDIKVCECSDGDILAADIFNRRGVKLVACNTTMNPYIIDKLKNLGVEHVRVYEPPVGGAAKEYKLRRLDRAYKENVMIVKDMLKKLASGRKLDVRQVTKAADTIYDYLGDVDSDNIVKYLNRIHQKDEYTYSHCVNVAFYSMLLAKWMNLSETEVKKAIQAGFLHDIGKAKVPLKVLNKITPLTREEFAVIKKHPIYGYYILDSSNFVDTDIKRAVLLHHERINRSGYPFNISANKIGLLTRIVSVADVYDAMTSDRVYKKKATPFSAFEMFLTVGSDNFDPYVVSEFVSHMGTYLTGLRVRLNDGRCGSIAYVPPEDPRKPVVLTVDGYLTVGKSGVEIGEML